MARAAKDLDAPALDDPDGLTHRQIAFINHYLGDCRFNAAAAARKAGYKVRTSASDNMSNPIIRARIDAELAALTATRDEVLTMLIDDATMDVDAIMRRADVKADPAARSSAISALMNARTTARGTLAKAYGLLSDKVQAGGGIVIKIEGITGEEV